MYLVISKWYLGTAGAWRSIFLKYNKVPKSHDIVDIIASPPFSHSGDMNLARN